MLKEQSQSLDNVEIRLASYYTKHNEWRKAKLSTGCCSNISIKRITKIWKI